MDEAVRLEQKEKKEVSPKDASQFLPCQLSKGIVSTLTKSLSSDIPGKPKKFLTALVTKGVLKARAESTSCTVLMTALMQSGGPYCLMVSK